MYSEENTENANLQKVQIIKGWSQGGQAFETVYDVVCSDGLKPSAETHRCPDNGATVDIHNCSYSTTKGAAELATTWTDPDFKASDRAFYYTRVFENPTCRWSTDDAMVSKVKLPDDVQRTIQERAWSSPIWYTPSPSGK